MPDIFIQGLNSFNFIENKTVPEYPYYDNLGITGKIILNCHTGTCSSDIFHKKIIKSCNDDNCRDIDKSWTENQVIIDYNCSEQCYETGKKECKFNETYDNIGVCERK